MKYTMDYIIVQLLLYYTLHVLDLSLDYNTILLIYIIYYIIHNSSSIYFYIFIITTTKTFSKMIRHVGAASSGARNGKMFGNFATFVRGILHTVMRTRNNANDVRTRFMTNKPLFMIQLQERGCVEFMR